MKLVEGEGEVLCTATEKPKNTQSDVGVLEQRQNISENGRRGESERFRRIWEKEEFLF